MNHLPKQASQPASHSYGSPLFPILEMVENLDQRFLNLAARGLVWGIFRNTTPGLHPGDSDLIGLGCSLGRGILKNLPGDSNVQQCWRRTGIDPSQAISDLKGPHPAADLTLLHSQICTAPKVYREASIQGVNRSIIL